MIYENNKAIIYAILTITTNIIPIPEGTRGGINKQKLIQ